MATAGDAGGTVTRCCRGGNPICSRSHEELPTVAAGAAGCARCGASDDVECGIEGGATADGGGGAVEAGASSSKMSQKSIAHARFDAERQPGVTAWRQPAVASESAAPKGRGRMVGGPRPSVDLRRGCVELSTEQEGIHARMPCLGYTEPRWVRTSPRLASRQHRPPGADRYSEPLPYHHATWYRRARPCVFKRFHNTQPTRSGRARLPDKEITEGWWFAISRGLASFSLLSSLAPHVAQHRAIVPREHAVPPARRHD